MKIDMYSMKRAGKLALSVAGLSTALLMSSCSTDDDTVDPDPDPQPMEDPFVLSLAILGSENTYTYYTVPFEDVMTGTLSAVGQGIEQPGYYDFKKIDNTIYSMGGMDNVDVVGISQDESGELTRIGDVSFATSLSDLVRANDNTLLAVSLDANSDMVTFHTINENSVTATNTVSRPISDLTEADVPAYSGMRVVGDQVFLAYYISNPDTWETNFTAEAKVGVYSYPELEFQEVITDDRVGPIGGFVTKSGLIKDESGDIYAVSHSNPANGFSQFTNDSGILRINNGETEFDPDYYFDVEDIAGGNVVHLMYLGNGKAFAEINMEARADQAMWSDSPLQSAIIDLNNETVTFIDGIPEHSGPGRRLPAHHEGNHIYTAIPGDNGISVYRIDTNTFEATKGADIEANFVAGFFRL